MYSKEAHLNQGHNAANEKRIGVHKTEKTSKNYPNICTRKFFDYFFVYCVVIASNALLLSTNKPIFQITQFLAPTELKKCKLPSVRTFVCPWSYIDLFAIKGIYTDVRV